MPSQSKYDMLAKAKASIEGSKGIFVINYSGLTVKEAQDFRRSLREASSSMKVYKNTIMRIALKEESLPDIGDELQGTCAYVFYENDPVDAAKAIKAFADTSKKVSFVGGIADGGALTAETAAAYAELPSRDELVARLVYVLGSPLSGIASVLAGPARGLATVLDKVAEQKEAA